ncbi:excitatory amino acid transporter 1-like [Genypterus blacodes]|uniref:excitatory amino acid transporter 1-like n=1 Tax=Genypterus blacodes TaxID=154954 RepID=UPI003F76F6AC
MPPNSSDSTKFDTIHMPDPEETQKRQKDPDPERFLSSPKPRPDVSGFLKRHASALLTLSAIAGGICLGFSLRLANLTTKQVKYICFPGELMLRMLQMLVLPLVISSVITGMSFMDRKVYGKMAIQAFSYYIGTTFCAILTGIVLVMLIQPGKHKGNYIVFSGGHVEPVQTVDAFLDLIRNMFPPSLVEACFRKYKTAYNIINSTTTLLEDNLTEIETIEKMPKPGTVDGVNVLGLVIFCVGFGLILGSLEDQGKPLRDLFDCMNAIVMRLVTIAIWYSPVGIIFLIGGQIMQMKDLGVMGNHLAMYTLCVITGLFIHGFVTLPAIYFAVTRKNPYVFMSGLLHALVTAFGTASSSATLPVTIQCLQRHCMDKRVMRFVLPLGAITTMDGTALYEAVAAIFIAQMNDVELNLGHVTIIIITSTTSTIGATSIPQAGLVTLVMVLTSVGLPAENITFIIAVDCILDRLRTATNVLGDCYGVGVVQHLCKDTLPAKVCLVEEKEENPK